MIQSPDEEDNDNDEETGHIPEGFHLLEESVHCLNIGKSEEFKAYCQQICMDLIQMVRQGRGVEEEYQKVMRSIYWACKAVGNGSLVAGVDPECVAGSVKDLNCVAWRLKLTGKAEAILKELLVDEGEDPQVAIETKEIEEAEIYSRIKADMDRLPEDKRKELRQHIQGVL